MTYSIDAEGFFGDVNGFRVQKQPADMPHTSYGAGFPKGILWHYTVGCNDDIKRTLESNGFGGAAFNVGRDGSIHEYAPVFTATWHAREAGQYYVGIEHTTKGPSSECSLTEVQLKASAALSAAIVELVKDRKGFDIPLVKLVPPVELNKWRPGFLDHTDGPNAIEAGGKDKTWNDAGHTDHLFRWTWPQYLAAVRSHLEDEMGMTDAERSKLNLAAARALDAAQALNGVEDFLAGRNLNPDWPAPRRNMLAALREAATRETPMAVHDHGDTYAEKVHPHTAETSVA